MDEEQFYGYTDSSNSDYHRYDKVNLEDTACTYGASSYRTDARNGNVANRQRKTRDSGIKLKRCPSFLLGKPLADFDCSDDHEVSTVQMNGLMPRFA